MLSAYADRVPRNNRTPERASLGTGLQIGKSVLPSYSYRVAFVAFHDEDGGHSVAIGWGVSRGAVQPVKSGQRANPEWATACSIAPMTPMTPTAPDRLCLE